MLVKMFFSDRVVGLVDFVGMNLLVSFPYSSSFPLTAPIRFLQLLPNCFLRVCLPIFFATVLKFFLPLTNSAIFGADISINSAPTCFVAVTTILCKNGIAVFLFSSASAPNHLAPCRPVPL